MQDKQLAIEDVTEQMFADYLSTGNIPDPDLFIRTAGEQRISNFLIWQMAYTEFYYTDVFWPEFNEQQLHMALEQFSQRKRRFGLTQEQVEANPSA